MLGEILETFRKGNLPQAELLCRNFLDQAPGNPAALTLLGDIAVRIGAYRAAQRQYSQALSASPHLAAAQQGYAQASTALLKPLPRTSGKRKALLIKAWGYGFWSDVDHVIGQLLLAEMTGRAPVVYWGKNSLFRSPESGNAFELYFAPASDVSSGDLANPGSSFYPPKWSADNLLEEELNKWSGPYSRVAGIYLLHRTEDTVVSDFYTAVLDLIPWLEPGSEYLETSRSEIYRRLYTKYFRLRPHLQQKVETFWQQHMQGRRWLGVHVRGSDKVLEHASLERVNLEYFVHIDRLLGTDPSLGLFLLTDSEIFLDQYRQRYGARLLCTPCRRVAGEIGVHYAGFPGVQVAEEVILDAYLAARCDSFLGNGTSSVSNWVGYLKAWPQGRFALFEPDHSSRRNLMLHHW